MFSMFRTYCLFRTFLCYELDVSYENVYFLFPIRIIVLTKTISNVQGLCNK
mgnify:CR=1 FL=1